MSAPNTNLKTEARRHRPALIGITVALAVAAIALAVWLFFLLSPEASLESIMDEDQVEEAAPVDPQSENDGDALLND